MGVLLLWVLVFTLSQSTMIHGVFQDIRGLHFDLGASIARGLRRFFPVIGTSIYAFFMVMIGMFLVVVPGFIAIIMLFVVIPVCVVEGLGPGASIKRSRELTKGQRWRLLAIYLAPAIVIAICNTLLQRLGLRVFDRRQLPGDRQHRDLSRSPRRQGGAPRRTARGRVRLRQPAHTAAGGLPVSSLLALGRP
jgi:hypothetical protein